MSLNRYNPRADGNQMSIKRTLEKVGAKVVIIGLPLDLLVAYKGRTMLMECKMPKGNLTESQEQFFNCWPGEKHLVRSEKDALRALGVLK